MKFKVVPIIFLLFVYVNTFSQEIPANVVVKTTKLANYLKDDIKASIKKEGNLTKEALAAYLRKAYAERYFFNWNNFQSRFNTYQMWFPNQVLEHSERAADHMAKFSADTPWKLPFNYLNGDPVNAYAVRHLARQHKMIDVAFQYSYTGNVEYLNYFKIQLNSLNSSLKTNQFEQLEDGNGTYEAFRSGYRVLNWLQIHAFFLGSENYSDDDQLTTIATLLQHGANLYSSNTAFVPGNHQTRGMSALAMLSILFRDFKGTEKWYERAMTLLEEHLKKEINDDGFQFERSVHYHMSDIDNYYYVYQLAKISDIQVNPFWEEKLKSLFTTLVKIAYPDGSSPVFQDDTDNPWAEKNDISGALTLGYLLFEDPEMGYFAKNSVEPKMFWYLNETQLSLLNNIQQKQPTVKSYAFPTTGYYFFREGWQPNDKMMAITAGLDKEKPDHQHGDMLGVQAMAYGKILLPNYQVRYSLPDYEFFKNSLVKNVALVDALLQGKKYKGNQGGSGFGKFGELPTPKVIAFDTQNGIEYFIGSHNGFQVNGVQYTRQVINVQNDFWIVKDNFYAEDEHVYKQVWQGHYSLESSPKVLRATFDDATGLDIYQFNKVDTVESNGKRGKQWSIISKKQKGNFSFTTMLFPYKGFDNSINEYEKSPLFKGWKLTNNQWKVEGEQAMLLSKENQLIVLSASKIWYNNVVIECDKPADFIITINNNTFLINSITDSYINLKWQGLQEASFNGKNVVTEVKIAVGEQLICKI